MNGTKWWLDSNAVRGALVTAIPSFVGILALFHVQIGTEEVNAIIDGIAGIAGLLGAAWSIYGSLTRQHSLTTDANDVTV